MNIDEANTIINQLFDRGLSKRDLMVLAAHHRRLELEEELLNILHNRIAEGLFQGVLHSGKAHHSTLCPKLLGSYESEIAENLKSLIDGKSCFIDIGCAEGYYTTGIASKTLIPLIIGIDTDELALAEAEASAALNNVNEKCFFSTDLVKGLDLVQGNCLAMIDVDGNELSVLKTFCEHFHQQKTIQISLIIETDYHCDGISNSQDIQSLLKKYGYTITDLIGQDVNKRFTNLSQSLVNGFLDLTLLGLEGRPSDQHWIIANLCS